MAGGAAVRYRRGGDGRRVRFRDGRPAGTAGRRRGAGRATGPGCPCVGRTGPWNAAGGGLEGVRRAGTGGCAARGEAPCGGIVRPRAVAGRSELDGVRGGGDGERARDEGGVGRHEAMHHVASVLDGRAGPPAAGTSAADRCGPPCGRRRADAGARSRAGGGVRPRGKGDPRTRRAVPRLSRRRASGDAGAPARVGGASGRLRHLPPPGACAGQSARRRARDRLHDARDVAGRPPQHGDAFPVRRDQRGQLRDAGRAQGA